MQEAGEPLRLKYEAAHYGPYAHNLNKVLEVLEGHFITGSGDSQKPDVEIELLPGAVEEAEAFLTAKEDSLHRLERISDVIEGFETPYGMELLSSIHWVCNRNSAKNVEQAIQGIYQWNDRKRKIFKEEHIKIAWERLNAQGWLLG